MTAATPGMTHAAAEAHRNAIHAPASTFVGRTSGRCYTHDDAVAFLTLRIRDAPGRQVAGTLVIERTGAGRRCAREVRLEGLPSGPLRFDLPPGRYDILFEPAVRLSQPVQDIASGERRRPPLRAHRIARRVEVGGPGGERTIDAAPLRATIRDWDGAEGPLRGAAVYLRRGPAGAPAEAFLTDREGLLCSGLDAPEDVHLAAAFGEQVAWIARDDGPLEANFANVHLAAPGGALPPFDRVEPREGPDGLRTLALALPGGNDLLTERVRRSVAALEPAFLDALEALVAGEDPRIVPSRERGLLLAYAISGKASAILRSLLVAGGRFRSVRQLAAGLAENALTGRHDSAHSFLEVEGIFVDPTIAQFYSGYGPEQMDLKRAAVAKLPPSVLRHGFVGSGLELRAFLERFRFEPFPPPLAERLEPPLEKLYQAGVPIEALETPLALEARAIFAARMRAGR